MTTFDVLGGNFNKVEKRARAERYSQWWRLLQSWLRALVQETHHNELLHIWICALKKRDNRDFYWLAAEYKYTRRIASLRAQGASQVRGFKRKIRRGKKRRRNAANLCFFPAKERRVSLFKSTHPTILLCYVMSLSSLCAVVAGPKFAPKWIDEFVI